MKECLECGYEGSNPNFNTGCPMCGNWDSWRIKDKGILQGSEEDFENERKLNNWDDDQAEEIWDKHYRYSQ